MRRTLATLAAVLLLASCSPSQPEQTPTPSPVETSSAPTPEATPTPTPTPTPTASPLVDPLWSVTGVTFAGEPIAVGDTAISYFVAEQNLFIGAWRASDGAKLWDAPSDTSHTAGGVWIKPAASGNNVVYLTPAGTDGYSTVTVVEAATGTTVGNSELIWAQSRPAECAEGACVTGVLGSGATGRWQVGPEATLSPSTSGYLPPNARILGEDVYSTNDRPGEILGLGKNGATVWQRGYEEVFGAGYSSDAGWGWYTGEGWPLVGFGYLFTDDQTGHDMAASKVVGLDPATGATLWEVAGAQMCATEAPADLVVLCVLTSGRITYATEEGALPVYTDVVATLQGLDPMTGQAAWTVPLDASNWGATYGEPFVDPADAVIRYIDGQPTSIDRATGETTPLPAGEVLACTADRDILTVLTDGGTDSKQQYLGSATTPCDAQRADAPQFSQSAVEAAGVVAGDVRVVATRDGLQGFASR